MLEMLYILCFTSSLPLLIFLYFSCLLGSRATVFWDHMTISQSRPPPLPMCFFPHGVASPAQSRPAHWNPPALPRPSWGTASSPTSQVHPGLKVHQSQEAEQQHVHMASIAVTCHPLRTKRRWIYVLPSSSDLFVLQDGLLFLSGVKEPMKDSPKPELLKQYCVLFARPVFHKHPSVTLKTVGWWWLEKNSAELRVF